jgi:PPIC-type PPIASE domain
MRMPTPARLPGLVDWDSGLPSAAAPGLETTTCWTPGLSGLLRQTEDEIMQRNTAIAVGLLFALGIVLLATVGRHSPRSAAVNVGSAHTSAPSAPPPSASAAPSAKEEAEAPADPTTESFDTLPDGRKVPPLPDSAPKQVGFGVVVVAYQGAQAAPKDARSKEEALRKAEALVAEAKQDFAAAVAKGDHGSTSDAGHVPRDVLEPAVEYLLFTLQKRDVYAHPIDTPRGYWIVRRNE